MVARSPVTPMRAAAYTKPRALRGHGFEALGGRVRGDQEDAVESVTVGGFDPLPRLVRDEVRGDEAGAAGVLEVAAKRSTP